MQERLDYVWASKSNPVLFRGPVLYTYLLCIIAKLYIQRETQSIPPIRSYTICAISFGDQFVYNWSQRLTKLPTFVISVSIGTCYGSEIGIKTHHV
jgi:hypothetical protein